MNWKERIKLIWPKYQKLILDYPVEMKPRYGHGLPSLPAMEKVIADNTSVYQDWAQVMLEYASDIQKIRPAHGETDTTAPAWNNGFLPGLDVAALYSLVRKTRPKRYVEVGSGNSTKVAFRAKQDGQLDMKIVSIDPYPRAEIDALADEVVRAPFESGNWKEWSKLSAGDVVFIDNSHRVLPNSDAMVFFMEVLPQLPKGVLVHVHDIYWPFDYPQEMCDRFYSEQYVLGAFLLANPQRYRTVFPAYYFSQTPSLSKTIDELWNHAHLEGVERHGGSYWLEIGE